VAAAVVLHAAATTAQVASDWASTPAVGLGPLLLSSQAPVNLVLLTPTPMPPVTISRGRSAVALLESWNNYFDVDPRGRFFIGGERLGITLGVVYGITDRLDVSATLPLAYRGGGILDGFIEWFETRLGVPNEERRRYPRDRGRVLVHGEDGTTYQLGDGSAGWGLEDGTAALRYQVARGSETTPAVLIGLGVRIPTGREDALRSSGGLEVEGGVSVGQKLGRFHLYGGANLMQHGRSEFLGIRLRRTQWSLSGGLEYRASPRTSILLQGLMTSGPAEHFGDFSRNSHEITLGFKRVLSRDLLLEASVLENLFVFDNSPDVGFHVGLIWRSPERER
jgi:hypothetical protein